MRRPSPYRVVRNGTNGESPFGTSAHDVEMGNVANLTPAQRSQRRRRRRERQASEQSHTGSDDSSGGEHNPDIRTQSNHGRRSRTYRIACHMPLRNEVNEHYLGPFTFQCAHCYAFHWMAEKRAASPQRNPDFAECCRAGEVAVDSLEPIPLSPRAL
ncbi:hypothetical protein EDB85DRAFT_548155 [Lactarius pseudohatsudake]|nr:hypothetical protein EDB85DRAFT_548155 [Lactarius pseudohatsudake]